MSGPGSVTHLNFQQALLVVFGVVPLVQTLSAQQGLQGGALRGQRVLRHETAIWTQVNNTGERKYITFNSGGNNMDTVTPHRGRSAKGFLYAGVRVRWFSRASTQNLNIICQTVLRSAAAVQSVDLRLWIHAAKNVWYDLRQGRVWSFKTLSLKWCWALAEFQSNIYMFLLKNK